MRPGGGAALAAIAALALGRLAYADTADDLRAVAEQSTVQLTTIGRTSGELRPVTIWFVGEGDRVFVQSGKEGQTDWYRNALVNPAVTLRIGVLTLRGQARPVDDSQETARVHRLFEQKYLGARVLGWFGSAVGHGKVIVIDQLQRGP